MAKQVFISSNTIQLTAEEAYPSFAGKGITFVVLDDINYQHIFYYVEYKDGDNYITHRFTNDEISGNTFTWTDTRAVPDTTSLRFYIVSGPKTVYTTEYLELEKPHDPYEKALVYRGVPTAVAPTLEEAAAIYSRYDMVVFLEGYEDPSGPHYHEVEELIKLIDIDTRVVGRVYIGTLTMAYVKAKILRWKVIGAIGVVLDEIIITRAEQNELIDYAHSLGLFVLATGRDYDNIFAKDANNVTSKLTYGDYFVFETAFSDDIPGIQSPSNVDRMYKFWHTTNIWGKTYPEYYHVKTLQVDILPDQASANFSKKCQAFSLVGAAVFHNSAVAIGKSDNSIVDWDYSAIDFYSKDVPEVEVKSKTVGSTTFNYSWSAEINGNLHEVTFNAAGPDDRTYAEATHYMKYNDRHMVDVWASVYDHEKRIQDLEAGGGSTQVQADYAETDPTKVSYIKNKPTIGDATITITQAGVTKGTFTVNTTVSSTIALDMSTQEQANWTESSTTSPAYIKNKPSLATVAITGSYTDLTNKPSIPTVNDPAIIITQGGVTKGRFTLNQSTTGTIEVDAPIEQVQSDWNESTTTSKAYIKNKPSIPAAQIQSDWAQSTTTEVDYIKNKPTIPTVNDPTVTIMQGSVTKGSFSLNQASTTTITVDAPVEQVQSDWNESTTTSKAYIQNKPTIPTVYDSTITIMQGSVTKGSFTLNQATPATITLDMSSAQEQADWSESSTTAPSYIRNKPTIPSTTDCERITNKSTSWSATPDNTHYPSEKLVKDSLDAKGDLTIQWHETVTDAYYPSEKLVKDSLDGKINASSTNPQIIHSTSDNIPLILQGSSTGEAGIGFKLSTGTVVGYLGVKSDKKPFFMDTDTFSRQEISLKGHTHAAADVTSGEFDLARIPTIPSTKTSGFHTVATSGDYNDLENKPTIPAGQIQSDWTQSTTTSLDYIKNKPAIIASTTGTNATIENRSSNVALGNYSHAEGNSTRASAEAAHAEGYSTTAAGQASHVEGRASSSAGIASHAEGFATSVTGAGNYGHAEGSGTTVKNTAAHAEGYSTTASGSYSHAEGSGAVASAEAAHAEGRLTNASAQYSHAEGYSTTASGDYSHSSGDHTIASGAAQTVVGKYNVSSTTDLFIVGNGNSSSRSTAFRVTSDGIAVAKTAIQIGSTSISESQIQSDWNQSTTTAPDYIKNKPTIPAAQIQSDWTQTDTTALDYIKNKPSIIASTVASNAIVENYSGNVASSDYTHAEGYETTASFPAAHAEGSSTTAAGGSSHAEGSGTAANGEYSHAEGYNTVSGTSGPSGASAAHAEGDSTTASGRASHAEGVEAVASGDNSHAEGYRTTAEGTSSHAEGQSTKAIENDAHAEGNSTKASGYQAHAEGYSTTASGRAAHSEGAMTTANGDRAHAEGEGTTASGDYSHAGGYYTAAVGKYQTVIGKYNVSDTTSFLIVGNGTSTTRSNAFTVTSDGVAIAQTAIQIGNTSITESQIQSDWNQSTTTAPDYIKNKPEIHNLNPTSVSIPVASWSGTTATVPVEGITPTTDLLVAPATASMVDVISNKVYCSAQGTNILTFTCSTTPTSALTFAAWIRG